MQPNTAHDLTMTKPHFTSEFTLGNVVQVLTVIGAVITWLLTGGISTEHRATLTEAAVVSEVRRVDDLTATVDKIASVEVSLAQTVTGLNENQKSLLDNLKELQRNFREHELGTRNYQPRRSDNQ
jgi:uncharacterized membrane protein YciS (DUF1049 family)